MRKILLLLFVGTTTGNWAQDKPEYYHYPVHYPDSTTEIIVSVEKPMGKWNPKDCWKAEVNTKITGYTEYMDSLELDSAKKVFQEVIRPLIGDRILNRTHLYHVELYNTGKPYYLDSAAIQKYKNDEPLCLKIKWKFECYFMFEDSIWFPYEIYIDQKGRLLKPSSIFATLRNMENYKLKNPEYIFKKANGDPFMTGYPTRKFFDLAYSERLHYFYFESYSNKKDKTITKTDHSSLSLHRHIFIDAKTGNILWRPKVEHFHEHMGCVYNTEFRFPPNTLMK